jgi:ribosome-associated heat shock protein Hsp15
MTVRLDQWLDVACLFKTRSEATEGVQARQDQRQRRRAKAHRDVKVGDEIEIHRPMGRKQLVTVSASPTRTSPKAEARLLYEDRTPKPTPEEIEIGASSASIAPPRRRQRARIATCGGRCAV